MIRIILLTLFMICGMASAQAATLNMDHFGRIPVQHDGRIKPLDTFARVTLKTFSGADSLPDISATEWLAETLLDPITSANRPIFLIHDETTRHHLGLTDRLKPLYSYVEIAPGLTRTQRTVEPLYKHMPQSLTTDERALLKIHEDATIYTQILRTLSLILPLNIEVPQPWSKLIKTQDNRVTYLDLRKYQRDIEEATRKIILKKGEDPTTYNDSERSTAQLGYQLRLMGDAALWNELLRIIPVSWAEAKGEWQSPWAVLQQGKGSPDTGTLLKTWGAMATAWQSESATEWETATAQAAQMPLTLDVDSPSAQKLNLEILINQTNPARLSTLLYALSFILLLGFFVAEKSSLRVAASLSLTAGAFIHTAGIGARIFLLGRPPVSTLYESLIFVGLICVMIGGLIERKLHNGSGLLAAAVTGLFIGLLASSFGNEGDTLLQLSAVLDTSFWLATHVLCITIGYGWCVITAILAHISLTRHALKPSLEVSGQNLDKIIGLTGMVALLFTAIGTILGGIWADQSWGRFWGWDPKENGALLIVLWLVWVQHGILSGHMNKACSLAAYAFLSVVVGAAWLGVNLLGVGLHSYGFADGLFWGLGLFATAEIIYIGLMWYLIINPKQKLHAP